MKRILSSMKYSVSIACILFVLFGMYYDFKYQGSFHLENYMFSKMALGAILIGVGFSLPSIVYDTNLSERVKAIIHLSVGCISMIIISYLFGFLDSQKEVSYYFIFLLIQIFIAMVIWIAFYFYYKKLAKDMNGKIKEKQQS